MLSEFLNEEVISETIFPVKFSTTGTFMNDRFKINELFVIASIGSETADLSTFFYGITGSRTFVSPVDLDHRKGASRIFSTDSPT